MHKVTCIRISTPCFDATGIAPSTTNETAALTHAATILHKSLEKLPPPITTLSDLEIEQVEKFIPEEMHFFFTSMRGHPEVTASGRALSVAQDLMALVDYKSKTPKVVSLAVVLKALLAVKLC